MLLIFARAVLLYIFCFCFVFDLEFFKAGMGKVAGERSSRFAMALGDNFYSLGIRTDETDMRFEHTFENVFTSPNLMGDDYFRVLLGNHDHYGNVTAQV